MLDCFFLNSRSQKRSLDRDARCLTKGKATATAECAAIRPIFGSLVARSLEIVLAKVGY